MNFEKMLSKEWGLGSSGDCGGGATRRDQLWGPESVAAGSGRAVGSKEGLLGHVAAGGARGAGLTRVECAVGVGSDLAVQKELMRPDFVVVATGTGQCGGYTEVPDVLDCRGGEQCIAATGGPVQGTGWGQWVVFGWGKRGGGASEYLRGEGGELEE